MHCILEFIYSISLVLLVTIRLNSFKTSLLFVFQPWMFYVPNFSLISFHFFIFLLWFRIFRVVGVINWISKVISRFTSPQPMGLPLVEVWIINRSNRYIIKLFLLTLITYYLLVNKINWFFMQILYCGLIFNWHGAYLRGSIALFSKCNLGNDCCSSFKQKKSQLLISYTLPKLPWLKLIEHLFS